MKAKKLFVAELTEMLPVPMRLSIPSLNDLEICIPRVEKRITDVTYGWGTFITDSLCAWRKFDSKLLNPLYSCLSYCLWLWLRNVA